VWVKVWGFLFLLLFLKAEIKENSITRKLGVRFLLLLLLVRDLEGPPFPLRGVVSFLLCFIWFL